MKHRTNIYIDFDLIDWLKEQAKQRKCSMSQVIRACILECKIRRDVETEVKSSK